MTDAASEAVTSATPLGEEFGPEIHNENFGMAIAAGLGAAVLGALLWAVFVYLTHLELGLVAIALGALVGIAVQRAGRGSDAKFGVLGGACAAFGWALGTVLCDLAFVAKDAGVSFFEVLARVGLSGGIPLAFQGADGMELLFLAIAVWEGYKLSTRQR